MTKIKTAIREYSEGMTVEVDEHKGRPIIVAWNEGGGNLTQVDIEDVLDWVAENRPEMLAVKVPGN